MTKRNTIIFILLYYGVWFGCLTASSRGYHYLPLLISLVLSLIQCTLFLKKHLLVKLAYWICLCSSVGFGIDSILQFSGVIIYQSHPWPWFAPPWIFALWLNFSVVCFAMQDFLLKYHRYMSICAAFGFPIAYLGGIQFGVAQFSAPILGPLILSGIWAIVFPLLVLKCPNEKM